MGTDRGLLLTVCGSVGAALLVFALLPGPWPIPLPQGPMEGPSTTVELRRAAAAVDAACQRGDVAAFAAATTSAHRAGVGQSLQALDRRIEPRTLREIGARHCQAGWLDAEALAGEVRGRRAAIAVRRPQGDGAQILTFEWDGRRFLFDGSVQHSSVQDGASAAAAIEAALRSR